MQNQKTTPETDANAECDQEDGSPFAPVREWVHADFARRLERERNEARRLAAKYRNLSCEDQTEADATVLPWENANCPSVGATE